jgi:glycerol-3-phosphate dehydrogenase (NAD(P)+)
MAVVTIIGAGMMGTAMCWPLADREHEVRLVGTPLDEEEIRSIRECRVHPNLERAVPPGVQEYFVEELPLAVQGADLIIGGISSFGVEWFTQTVGPHFRTSVPVLSVTKGLEDRPNGDLDILPVVIDRGLPENMRGRISLNAIGGPCIAHELAARRQTAVVFTGAEESVLRRLREMLSTNYYHIWPSTDLVGVETCAALKNAYAMGVGLAVGMMEAAGPDGLANMYNPQAALFAQSCFEMRRLVRLLGGDDANITWLPGPGDLYVTVFGGRTVRLGKMLGQGIPFREARKMLAGVTLESVEIITRVARALPKLASRGLINLADFPLLLHMDKVLNAGEPVDIPWEAFFRDPYLGNL